MININHEGTNNDVWEDDTCINHESELTLDQQRELLLKDAQIALGKLEVKKLELEISGVEDFMTKTELKRLEDEVVKHKDLVESLGGEVE
jgi:hypothetical protein